MTLAGVARDDATAEFFDGTASGVYLIRRCTQHGHAWTAAYVFEPNPHWRFTLEWLRVSSNTENRALELRTSPIATETEIQLAVRFALGPRR